MPYALKTQSSCIQLEVLFLKCVVSVICQFKIEIFSVFSLIVGSQWKKQPSFTFPSATPCSYYLTCVLLHGCEIECKEDDRKLLLGPGVFSGTWSSQTWMIHFISILGLVHVEHVMGLSPEQECGICCIDSNH